jgi:hypothetical protein
MRALDHHIYSALRGLDSILNLHGLYNRLRAFQRYPYRCLSIYCVVRISSNVARRVAQPRALTKKTVCARRVTTRYDSILPTTTRKDRFRD